MFSIIQYEGTSPGTQVYAGLHRGANNFPAQNDSHCGHGCTKHQHPQHRNPPASPKNIEASKVLVKSNPAPLTQPPPLVVHQSMYNNVYKIQGPLMKHHKINMVNGDPLILPLFATARLNAMLKHSACSFPHWLPSDKKHHQYQQHIQ